MQSGFVEKFGVPDESGTIGTVGQLLSGEMDNTWSPTEDAKGFVPGQSGTDPDDDPEVDTPTGVYRTQKFARILMEPRSQPIISLLTDPSLL